MKPTKLELIYREHICYITPNNPSQPMPNLFLLTHMNTDPMILQ